jgi:galactoside O-acetyltransferase
MKINVHSSVEIRNSDKVTIKKNSIIKKGTIINGRSPNKIGISFGEETYIKEYCYIDAYDGKINFEGYTAVGQFSIIAGEGGINIGKYVMIGAHSYIITSNHIFKRLHIPYILQGNNSKPIIIKDNVWIGGNVIILPGVTIGENSVIGAGSIVDKDVPPNTLYYTTRSAGKNEIINHKEWNLS